jgi:alpha-beta hydrolase superfamily lysophospholipase
LDESKAILLPMKAGDGYGWHCERFFNDPGRRRFTQSPQPHVAEIVILHGVQSHPGWYQHTGCELAAAGYGVSMPERRGCGRNQEDRGDAPSFRRLLDDLAEYMVTLRPPRFLVGISWGGKLAVAMQRRHPGLTDGLVLIAPGLCPTVLHSFRDRLRIAAARFLSPRRKFAIPLNDPELFTANPERQQFIRDDRLGLHEATARFMFESARLDIYLRFAARRVTMPVLLLLAGQDRIIDNAATRKYVDHFATKDKTVIEYPDAHHTLEFELGGPPFISDVLTWVGARV